MSGQKQKHSFSLSVIHHAMGDRWQTHTEQPLQAEVRGQHQSIPD